MCGRYALHTSPAVLALGLGITSGVPVPPQRARYNVAPTQRVLVARQAEGGERELVEVHWGLVPHWAKDRKGASKLINARGETVAEKPSFRDSFKRRRCLLPMDGFYEWKVMEDGTKEPVYITMQSGEPFTLGAIWASWHSPEGERIETCAIVTTVANELMATIHDRMPVILDPADYDRWLDAQAGSGQDLIRPYAADEMRAWTVSKRVNYPRNDDPQLIERAA